jgi:chromosome segregation ATPase
MNLSPTDDGHDTGKQEIKRLQERYKTLNERKITAEANLKTAKERLAELQAQARAEYGTDDVDKLQEKLDEMKDANERMRAQYRSALDTIERNLAEVESAYGAETRASESNEVEP